MLKRDHSVLTQPAQQRATKQPWDWTRRRGHHVKKVLQICRHVVTLKIDDGRKAAALFLGGRLRRILAAAKHTAAAKTEHGE